MSAGVAKKASWGPACGLMMVFSLKTAPHFESNPECFLLAQ
jgi:hypothetical protein